MRGPDLLLQQAAASQSMLDEVRRLGAAPGHAFPWK
jgi:hypothetical protein